MNAVIFALLTIALASAPPNWSFVAEQPGVPHLHVWHNGIDLGRAANGTYFDYAGSVETAMHFVPDEIFSSKFQ